MLAALSVAHLAEAGEVNWFDPALGCGKDFSVTGKAADLPGCSGKLPKDAPPVELVLHDAKRALLDAEEALAKSKPDKLDALLNTAENGLTKPPGMNPALPDRWDGALPLYQREIFSLKNRRRLAPHLDKLRTAYVAAVESLKTLDSDDGPARVQKATQACLDAFAAVRADNVDLALELDLTAAKGPLKSLESDRAECDNGKKSAETQVRTREAAAKAKRAQLRKKLRGDRLKTFDAHPDALPTVDGDPATAATWTYGADTISFKGNKLAAAAKPQAQTKTKPKPKK